MTSDSMRTSARNAMARIEPPAPGFRAMPPQAATAGRPRGMAPTRAAAGLHGFLGEGEIREEEGQSREGAGREDSLRHVGGSFRDRNSRLSELYVHGRWLRPGRRW